MRMLKIKTNHNECLSFETLTTVGPRDTTPVPSLACKTAGTGSPLVNVIGPDFCDRPLLHAQDYPGVRIIKTAIITAAQ